MEKVKFDRTKAHQKYTLKSGEEVKGATTILSVINKPALLDWAWKMGRSGKDYKAVRDKAGGIGTLLHFLAECHVKHLEPDISEFSESEIKTATPLFDKFKKWWEENGFVLVGSEVQLVSERFKYGGTLDIVATKPNGRLTLIDLKTGKSCYKDYWYQVAGYEQLWGENNPSNPILDKIILRFDKESGDIYPTEKSDLQLYLQVFNSALVLYKVLQAV